MCSSDLGELPAEILSDRHLPAALHGRPDKLQFLLRRKTLAADRHGRADGTMTGLSLISKGRLGLTPELSEMRNQTMLFVFAL